METVKPIASSFRDPNGFVFVYEGYVYRAITQKYSTEYMHLMNSGLYAELSGKKLLICHTEVELPINTGIELYKTLFPEQIAIITYPYEWCYEQWREVLISFIEINRTALKYGMILQDATPFNFSFHDGKPIFIDTPSFIFYQDGDPWIAYRQFCECMLGPLALIKYNSSTWIKQFNTFINGIQLSYVSKQLPWKTYFNPTILLHIHLHARSQREEPKLVSGCTVFDTQKLLVLLRLLKQSVIKWNIRPENKSNWLDYYDEQVTSTEYIREKEEIMENWLGHFQPEIIVDLGANNGKFSVIGSEYAERVIAVESDTDCMNALYKRIVSRGITNIAIIQADLVQPPPGTGWNNKERIQLLQRLKGDFLLALALIHHLCITNNIPLSLIAELFAGITSKYAVVEFVPKSDAKVQKMLRNRKDVFDGDDEEHFILSFKAHFELVKIFSFQSSSRKLFLWMKK